MLRTYFSPILGTGVTHRSHICAGTAYGYAQESQLEKWGPEIHWLQGVTPWFHQTWLAGKSPVTEWMFLARKITYFNGPFSSTPCLMTPEGKCGSHSANIWLWHDLLVCVRVLFLFVKMWIISHKPHVFLVQSPSSQPRGASSRWEGAAGWGTVSTGACKAVAGWSTYHI